MELLTKLGIENLRTIVAHWSKFEVNDNKVSGILKGWFGKIRIWPFLALCEYLFFFALEECKQDTKMPGFIASFMVLFHIQSISKTDGYILPYKLFKTHQLPFFFCGFLGVAFSANDIFCVSAWALCHFQNSWFL